MPVVLRPYAKGKLTLNNNSSKCLNSNLVMPVVLGPDAKWKLTLDDNSFKLTLAYSSSSLTHFLQIYCTGLTEPRSDTFWAWAANYVPTAHILCRLGK